MSKLIYKIGTRGSPLALYQANKVKSLLEITCGINVEIIIVNTKGDKDLQLSLKNSKLTKGLFTIEIEDLLRSGEIDFAVHSLKDLPVKLEQGFELSAVLQRDDVRDVLITNKSIEDFSDCNDWIIGTSSPRRVAQIKFIYPELDIQFKSIRGNVQTRLSKLDLGIYDAIIMAKAGIDRLGLRSKISYIFPVDALIPAPGQAAIAIETFSDNARAKELADSINELELMKCVCIERSILHFLGGGCALPFGAYCYLENDKYKVLTHLSNESLTEAVRYNFEIPINYSIDLIEYHAQNILNMLSHEI